MHSNQVSYKIKKYVNKLKTAQTLEDAEIYQQKLKYYHRLNMFGGVNVDLLKSQKEQHIPMTSSETSGKIMQQLPTQTSQLPKQSLQPELQPSKPPKQSSQLPPKQSSQQSLQPELQSSKPPLPQLPPKQSSQQSLQPELQPSKPPLPQLPSKQSSQLPPKQSLQPELQPSKPPLPQQQSTTKSSEIKMDNIEQLKAMLRKRKEEFDKMLQNIKTTAKIDTTKLEDNLKVLGKNIDELKKISFYNKGVADNLIDYSKGLETGIFNFINKLTSSEEPLNELENINKQVDTITKQTNNQTLKEISFNTKNYPLIQNLDILINKMGIAQTDNEFQKYAQNYVNNYAKMSSADKKKNNTQIVKNLNTLKNRSTNIERQKAINKLIKMIK